MPKRVLLVLLLLVVSAAWLFRNNAYFSHATTASTAAPPASSAPSAPAQTPLPPGTDLYALSLEEFFKLPQVSGRIGPKSVNIPLLDAAIFHQTNRERMVLKLAPFKHSWALNLMARNHSQEMGDLQFFDHSSPTPANRTLSDRLRNVGLVNVTAGENIAVLPAKEMGSGSYLIHENPDGTETWTDEATGKRIDYYTYQEISAAVVKQWMNSPGHRANIVDPRFLYLGAAAARGPYGDKRQDSFYMTQNFSGTITPASEEKARKQLVPAAGAPATGTSANK